MKSIAMLVAGVALAATAQAATVSFTFNNPLQITEISQTGNLGLFDSSLGTLTGVSLVFTGQNSTNLSLTNTASQAQTTRATSTTDLFWGSSLGALNGLITAANPVISLSATTGFVTLAAGGTQSFGPLTDSQNKTWTSGVELAGILNSFVGSGTFGLTCDSISGLALQGGGGNVRSTQSTQAGCGATIEYTYTAAAPTPVPEPASLALVGLALAGLSVARRNARKA